MFESWVINLKRREDRKKIFLKKYLMFGPNVPINFVEAVDGTDLEAVENHELIKCIGDSSEYDHNPRVKATILSHLQTWKNIKESGKNGLIFEDDINFSEDGKFKRLWSKFAQNLPPKFKKENSIIYFGTGDVLPIHVNIPTATLLRAVEKSHALAVNKFYGKPKLDSPYIFDWLGGFSYILSPKTAEYLLDQALENPINKAVDVWLKDMFESGTNNFRYVTMPLLTYHNSYDLNVYDSDIWGVSIPQDIEKVDEILKSLDPVPEPEPEPSEESKDSEVSEESEDSQNSQNSPKKLVFLIPTINRVESLEKTLESIISKQTNNFEIEFAFAYDSEDNITKEYISNFSSDYPDIGIQKIETSNNRYDLHEIYNELLSKLEKF